MSDVVHVIRATVDPSAAPTRAGQHWVNTATKNTWLSVGIATVADWILFNDSNLVKISGTDTTAGFLGVKLAAGSGIAFTTLNPGANEVISISAPGSTTDEKVKVSATDTTPGYLLSKLTAGTGITLTQNNTGSNEDLGVKITNTAVTAGSYGSSTQVATFTVNAQGQLTAAANAAISLTSSSITDFNEAAQDAVGTILTDSSSIDFTYSDAGNTITAVVLPGGVDHNLLLNFVANKHIDHSTVSLIAGTGISATGLGDITASRTINIANTAVTASSYGSASQVATFTVNAQGQLTAAASTSISITASQVSDFAEATDDRVAALLVAGTNVTLSYNDPSNTLTINATTQVGTGLKIKAGTVTAGTFTGTPRKATITFGTAFASTAYAIVIAGTDNRSWSWESKSTTGFVISSNAATALTGNVDWHAVATGESN